MEYTETDHFLVKLLANNAMKLEEKIKELNNEVKDLTKTNDTLYRNYNIIKEKYDNAIHMLHGVEPVKQEIATQPELFEEVYHQNGINLATRAKQIVDKATEYNDPTQHFKMQLARRKLTTDQAQHAWDMIVMGNVRIADIAKKLKCSSGTISNIINGVSYKEIDRSKK